MSFAKTLRATADRAQRADTSSLKKEYSIFKEMLYEIAEDGGTKYETHLLNPKFREWLLEEGLQNGF